MLSVLIARLPKQMPKIVEPQLAKACSPKRSLVPPPQRGPVEELAALAWENEIVEPGGVLALSQCS
jgi:hypothetical protein